MNENKAAITHDEELALHVYLQQAEDLSRLIRLASGGHLTLALAENAWVPLSVREKAGIVTGPEWMEAHAYASRLGGHSVTQNEFTDTLMARHAAGGVPDRLAEKPPPSSRAGGGHLVDIEPS